MKPPVELDLIGEYAIRQGMTYTLGFGIFETSLAGVESMMDTSAMEARFKIRATDYDGAVAVEGSTDDGRVVLAITPGNAARTTAVVLGEQCTSAGLPFNGFLYQCTTAGTTSGSAVALDETVIGSTTADGTAVWELIGPVSSETVVNAYILLDASYTETLVDWGRGRWDFELVDGSTVFRLFEGVARLSREVTY